MKHCLILIAALAVASCSSSHTPTVECGPSLGLPKANLLLVGEMHGSVESPQLIGQIACSLSKDGAVAVGLEVPTSEQSSIDAFLNSDGGSAAKEALVSGLFWQKIKDGRSSHAVASLLEQLRKYRQAGLPLTAFAFDSQDSFPSDRNEELASTIRAYKVKHPSEKIVALMGNAHATQADFFRSGEAVTPSGKLLEDLNPISVLLTHNQGTIWACMPDCGIHNVNGTASSSGNSGFLSESPRVGYNHGYQLPTLTASPPDVDYGP